MLSSKMELMQSVERVGDTRIISKKWKPGCATICSSEEKLWE
jgi:hypothetical protein